MAIQDYIENHSVFTVAELLSTVGDSQANRNLLSRAHKAGKVQKVSTGVYVSNTGRYRADDVLPFDVAKKLGNNPIFCYSSALDLHFGLHDICYNVSFYDGLRTKTVDFQSYNYCCYPTPEHIDFKQICLFDGSRFFVTTKEQTIVDCLDKPNRAGGVESIFRSLSTLNRMNVQTAIDLAISRSKSTAAKLGWLLETKKDEWNVSVEQLNQLEKVLSEGPYFFTPALSKSDACWCPKWKIYLPEPQETMEGWING